MSDLKKYNNRKEVPENFPQIMAQVIHYFSVPMHIHQVSESAMTTATEKQSGIL